MSDRIVISAQYVQTALRDGYTVRREGDIIVGWKDLPGLTARQRDAYDFICAAWEETGVSPSYDEIGVAIELRSRSNIHRIVIELERRGYLIREPYCARSLRPTEYGTSGSAFA